MKIYRKSPGISVCLEKATQEDLNDAEVLYPYDSTLPTLSALESWALVIDPGGISRKVGFVEYFVRDQEMVVTGLWVAPDKRGNGYGTILLDLAEAAEGPDFVRVIATPSSETFYVKRGFLKDYGHTILTKTTGKYLE